jgi:hypothetical protein
MRPTAAMPGKRWSAASLVLRMTVARRVSLRWFDLFGASAHSRSCELLCDIFEQRSAIGLDRQGVVATPFQNRRCKPTPAVQCIGCNDAAFEVEKLQHFQSSFRLVAAGCLPLSQRHTSIRCKNIDQMQRAGLAATLVSPAQSLAVDRHYARKIELVGLCKRSHEPAEGTLEGLRIQQTEHTAERVVARNPMLQLKHEPQQPFLRLPEVRHVGTRLRSAQHSGQRYQQHV